MLSTKTAARTLVALVVASLAAIALTATASGADATTIRIWTDKDRLAAVTKVANAWAASKGATIEVVQKDFGQIRDNLKTVQAETAPDVIVGAHDWIGELSANGSIVPLFPSTATKKQFPAYALDAFSYGTAIKKLYGAPVALENIAPRDEHEARQGPDDAGRSSRRRRSRRRRRRRPRSRSPSSRARAATRTTCTRSSRASAATSSARTPPATSTRRTSASRTRSS